MFTFRPPWITPGLTVTRWMMRAAPGPYAASSTSAACSSAADRLLMCGGSMSSSRCSSPMTCAAIADGAGAGVGIGAVRARRAHVEAQPERSLLTEAHGVAAAGLAVQAAIAEDFRMVLDQVARAPGAEGLLVRDRAERQPAMQRIAQLVQIEEREQRGRGAALHVAGAAAVDLAVDQLAAPGVDGPAGCGPPETRPCGRSARDAGRARRHRRSRRCWASSRSAR